MRIGILTFHTSINNGAVIQCYSLSKKLRETFPEAVVEVIDYRMPKVIASYDATVARYLQGGSPVIKLKKLAYLLLNPGMLHWRKKRNAVFERVLPVLPLSQKMICDDGVEELFAHINESYDVVVAGSDAIWNYVSRGFPNPYFLDDSIRCKKLSYAASCYGMTYESIPLEQREKIGKILDSYYFLGVRDGESEKFVKEMGCCLTPLHTCDPTVFLDVDRLPVDEAQLKTKLKNKGFDFFRPTIAMMGNEKMYQMIRALYGKAYQIVALYNYIKGADVNLYDLTPYEWAYVFRYFKLTVTTFFHGTLLSLRNGVPVISIALETGYSKNHMTKVEDFLRRVGLEDCYFSTDYKSKNFEAIKKKADELLAKDSRADICARMDAEVASCQPFMDAMRKILREEKENIE